MGAQQSQETGESSVPPVISAEVREELRREMKKIHDEDVNGQDSEDTSFQDQVRENVSTRKTDRYPDQDDDRVQEQTPNNPDFDCPVCHKSNRDHYNLRRHVSKVHPDYQGPMPKPKKMPSRKMYTKKMPTKKVLSRKVSQPAAVVQSAVKAPKTSNKGKMSSSKAKTSRASTSSTVANEYYECAGCHFECHKPYDLMRHCGTHNHKKTLRSQPGKTAAYKCHVCRVICDTPSDFADHCQRRSHLEAFR